ncbi:MAG: hypothetical protein M3O28_01215, partial [Actinomycetota bacterium]|nr:hypothetical protein [Actinomycetota bacterium]
MPEPTPTPEADSPAPAALIRLALHRRVTVTAVGEEPILLERKQAALMAYLHYAGMTPRGRLATLLWPQASASGARSNLRQCLARLRRIAPGVVAESFEAVGLAPHLAVEQLEDGRAELLEAHDYADCDDFERWLRERNDAMRAQLKATLVDAVRAAIDHGAFSEAQARAEALLTFDHESEDAYRALMEVAYLRGDFAAGVRAWGRCRDMLREFYGVAPSKATETLGSAILAAAPAIPIEPAGEPVPDRTPANRRDRWSAPDASAHTAGQPMVPSGRGNLSLTSAALYGRSAELAALLSALHLHRLVTLIGIGGIGKTSLALAAAHAERERWPEGVWFVDLAPLRDADSVAVATAHVLGLTLASHRSPADELVLALRASSILLVLDNAEHLSEAVASLTAALLLGTPHLRLLVTSRQALRVADEQRFPLSGLSAPTDPGLSDLQRHGALALFEARVSALDPSFRLTAGNATAVAEVCRRLDGLPLAIELAAARVPVLGLDELRSRLHESLGVLGAAAKISAPRHQTLSATFDWTYALLAPEEQTLLRRLALFVGGFSLKLAEEVSCGYDDGSESKTARDRRDAWSLLDTLSALI